MEGVEGMWMALRHSTRQSISSGILQRRLFLLMLQSKCCVPPASAFRAYLKGDSCSYTVQSSLHPFLQQALLRAGRVCPVCGGSPASRDFGHMAFIGTVMRAM